MIKTVNLDLTRCKTLGEIHERIQRAFSFPDWYGKNLDAFYDLLRTECDADIVLIIGTKDLSDELKEELNSLRFIMEKKAEFNKSLGFNEFKYEIKD
jgi:RNAse (barnase) inhibitor barstar